MDAPYLIHARTITPQAWRNWAGQTQELLTWPSVADWRLRISRADIEADGPFSAFAGVQRWFVVISCYRVVLHFPTPDGQMQDHDLRPGHLPLCFDGGLAQGCTLKNGPTQDLNLMARGGTALVQTVDAGVTWPSVLSMRGICTACSGTWTDGEQSITISAHTLLWMPDAGAALLRFTPDGDKLAQAWWLGYSQELSTCHRH